MQTLLVGTGRMGRAYAAVLNAMHVNFGVVGRSAEGVSAFTQETGIPATAGGVSALHAERGAYSHAIVAVDVLELPSVAGQLLDMGCRSILLEKPGALYKEDLEALKMKADAAGASVLIAYNRRYLASTRKMREMIEEDGGVVSFSFEFTEKLTAKESIRKFETPKEVEDNWFIGNSTHVIDLAFYLGGDPRELKGFSSAGPLWAPHPSMFSGAGMTTQGVPFAYHANWELPGPWNVTVGTKKRTLALQPLEALNVVENGTLRPIPIDDAQDKNFKPGFYRQVETFLSGTSELPTLKEHIANWDWYEKIRSGSQ